MDKQLFNFNRNDVRIIVIDNEPWFLGKEVANVLGYAIPQKAISDHVEETDKQTLTYKAFSETMYGNLWKGNDYSNKTIINEDGLYDLIFNSHLPSAKGFRKWVKSEVLPSIRKNGAYMTDVVLQKIIDDPDYMIGLLLNLKEERQKLDRLNK